MTGQFTVESATLYQAIVWLDSGFNQRLALGE